MRQILVNSGGAVVARMPRPTLDAGSVLVRVHYSLISAGTELAGLKTQANSLPQDGSQPKSQILPSPARRYILRALQNPKKAVRRLVELARQAVSVSTGASTWAGEGCATSATCPTEHFHSELNDQGSNVGYSLSGQVIAVGEEITDISIGDMVACSGAGQANHADYVCVKRNLVCRVPSGCPQTVAATATVGAIALQGVRRAAPQLGERVCVLGLGLIGQMTAQLLRAAGCTVMGLDLDESRIQKAKDLGMEDGDFDADRFKTLVRDRTEARGADKTIITAATRSDALINLAMQLTRRKGTVIVVGDVGLNVLREQFYRKEIDLLISTSYGPGRYDDNYEREGVDYPFAYVRWTLNRNIQSFLELAATGRINIPPLIEKLAPIDEAPSLYKTLATATKNLPLGVLIHYPEQVALPPDPPQASRITLQGHKKPNADRIRYALVGAGAFALSTLVPQMEKHKDLFFLRGIVSSDTARGGNFARANKVEVFSTSLAEIIKDPDFDLMVIATRHDKHADQVIAALTANKPVFVEKPLALTWEDLDRLVTTYRSLPSPPLLMVGYNRRFSPALQILKTELTKRKSPLFINYRLNAGYIGADSWIQQSQGGGRNVGEACHMYDVFRYLTGAPIKNISADAINPGSLPYFKNDNFVATLSYADGSVANLAYTALGTLKGSLGKERIEVFCDGEGYVIDDFKTLTRASDAKTIWQADSPDKGHAEELRRLGTSLAKTAPSPIHFDELIETTAVSLYIEDLIQGRNCHDEQNWICE